MLYFNTLPRTFYDLSGNQTLKPIVVANILARMKIREAIKNSTLIYYTYNIKETDTPEIIADKYYDDPNRHWIVLFANDIVDPQYDWPMSYSVFEKFIIAKYGSLETAKTTNHHYNKIITKLDSFTGFVTVTKYEIDAGTYASLPATSNEVINLTGGGTVTITTTKEAISQYSYEESLNESKRVIKIIDKSYAVQIENEMKEIFGL
jgi:hypothetical protein